MLVCLLFVVTGFIQSAFVVQLHQFNEEHLIRQKAARKWISVTDKLGPNNSLFSQSTGERGIAIKPRFNIHQIDLIACTVCVLMFLLFNVVYWVTLLVCDFN